MSRLMFVADPHVGNHRIHGGPLVGGINTRCEQILAAIRSAVASRTDRNQPIVVLGDLFDVDKPSPAVLAATAAAFGDAPVIAMVGNHDQTSDGDGPVPAEHALLPLAQRFTVVDTPSVFEIGRISLLVVPFSPAVTAESLPDIVADLARTSGSEQVRVLCVHLGISDGQTPIWLQGAHDSIPEKTIRTIARVNRIAFVEAGNWHDARSWGPVDRDRVQVSQVGALVPTGWDNPGIHPYGGIDEIDVIESTDGAYVSPACSRRWVYGPRFLSFGRPREERAENFERVLKTIAKPVAGHDGVKRSHQLYARLYVPLPELRAAAERVAAAVASGWIVAGEALPLDAAGARAEASTAAVRALADSLSHDEAIASFVRASSYPQGVSADAVLKKVRAYFAGGAS